MKTKSKQKPFKKKRSDDKKSIKLTLDENENKVNKNVKKSEIIFDLDKDIIKEEPNFDELLDKEKIKKEFDEICNLENGETAGRIYFEDNIKTLSFEDIQCIYCDIDVADIDSHVKVHKTRGMFACPKCTTNFESYSNTKEHYLKHLEEEKYECLVCQAKFRYKLDARKHMENLHRAWKEFQCKICFYDTSNKHNFNRHLEGKHQMKEYQCQFCDYKTNWSNTISNHIEHVHLGLNVERFECDVCGFRTSLKNTLQQHILRLHLKQFSFLCPHCDYKGVSLNKFKVHMNIHTKATIFECDHCDFVTNVKNSLDRHVRRKHGTYKCDQCNFVGSDIRTLRKHVRAIHVPKKVYTCEFCGKKMNQSSNKRTHIRQMHSGTNWHYRCRLCPEKFENLEKRREHIKDVHDNQSGYACPKCNQIYSSYGNLYIHLFTIHKVESEKLREVIGMKYKQSLAKKKKK